MWLHYICRCVQNKMAKSNSNIYPKEVRVEDCGLYEMNGVYKRHDTCTGAPSNAKRVQKVSSFCIHHQENTEDWIAGQYEEDRMGISHGDTVVSNTTVESDDVQKESNKESASSPTLNRTTWDLLDVG